MEVIPSVAPTPPPEVVVPVEIQPPVTGSNAEPMLRERVLTGLNRFVIKPDASAETHDDNKRTVKSVL